MKHLHILAAIALQTFVSCGVLRYQEAPDYRAGAPETPGYEPVGSVEEVTCPSSAPGPPERRMIVYLPPGYHDNEDRYPVVYLLHGARGYETSWIRKGDMLRITDSLFVNGLAAPSIVVMPNVNQYDDADDYDGSRRKGAFESILETDGAVGTAFRRDVVGRVDSLYRTLPDKPHRAVAGLSIGALQSAFLSANTPDTYGYVGLFSPIVYTLAKGADKDFYRRLAAKLETQFATDPPTRYFVMVGKWDFLFPHVIKFHRYLQKKGYPHVWITSAGGHDWKNWKDYYIYLMEHVFR